MVDGARSILVVDDDPSVLKLFETILKRGGYFVITAASGKRALEILRDQTVSLVVLDISMPEPDGFEILPVIRAHLPGLRVLAVSGFLGGALLDAAMHLGATAALNKADASEQLLERVNDLLRW